MMGFFVSPDAFQLGCLGALSLISAGALAVGILAIVFPPLVPIMLAAAIVITAVSAATLTVSMGMFAKQSQPKRPPSQLAIAQTKEPTEIEAEQDKSYQR